MTSFLNISFNDALTQPNVLLILSCDASNRSIALDSLSNDAFTFYNDAYNFSFADLTQCISILIISIAKKILSYKALNISNDALYGSFDAIHYLLCVYELLPRQIKTILWLSLGSLPAAATKILSAHRLNFNLFSWQSFQIRTCAEYRKSIYLF